MIKYTPLYNDHIKLNAQMINFGLWKMPVRYIGDKIEHLSVRKNIGLFDISHMGQIIIQGINSLKLCERLFTNNISKIINGQAIYCGMLNENGTFIDDVIVYKFSKIKFLICTNACNDKKDFNHIKHITNNEFKNNKIQIKFASNDYGQIAIQGPKTSLLLKKIFGEKINKIPFYHFTQEYIFINKQKINILLARTGYTGEDGFEIFIPSIHTSSLWQKLLKIGEKYNIKPCGLGARDTLRLESGMCLYGNEIDDSVTPLEAKLRWIVKFKKSINIIGKKALLQQIQQGISKKLCGLELLEKGIARKGYKLFNQKNEKIGQITSGSFAPFLKKSIAMAYIDCPFNKIGNKINIQIRNKFILAKIVNLPFYKRDKIL